MFDFIRNLAKSAAEKQRERLHTYVDGELSAAERQAFEQQMAADPALQAEVDSLRRVKAGLRSLPRVNAPRNFTLDPAVYGRPAADRLGQFLPALRVATALTAVLFVSVLVLDLVRGQFRAGEGVSFAPTVAELAEDEDRRNLLAEEAQVEVTRVVTEVEAETAAQAAEIAVEEEAPVAAAEAEEPAAEAAAAADAEAMEEPTGAETAASIAELPRTTPTPSPTVMGATATAAPPAAGDSAETAVEAESSADATGTAAAEPAVTSTAGASSSADPFADEAVADTLPAGGDQEVTAARTSLSGLRLAQYVLGTALIVLLGLLLLAIRRR